MSASVLAGLAPASAQSGIAISAQATARLHTYALGFAGQSGDAKPVSIHAVETYQRQAMHTVTPDNTVRRGGGQAVYLIVMKGKFRVNFPVPPGSRKPTGTYLSLMVSARTFQLIDLSLSHRAPHTALRLLGPVTTMTR